MNQEQYLTYAEYVSLGGTATEQNFNALEFKARKRIDRITDGRVRNMQEVPEAVKRLMMALITIDAATGDEAQAANPVVTSFNNDGYSESYGHAMSSTDADKRMNAIVGEYLYGELDDEGTPLIYRGIRG